MNFFSNTSFYKQKIFSSGLSVNCLPLNKQKSVIFTLRVCCGSAYETETNSGISHFLEHMLYRGNKKLGNSHELNMKFEDLGGMIDACSGVEYIEFSYRCHVQYFEKGLRYFCWFLQYPLFENFEIEKRIILSELQSDYNEVGTLINPYSVSSLYLWQGSSYALPVAGTPDSVSIITREALVAWHERFFQPANMVLGICGNIKPKEVYAIIDDEISPGKEMQRQFLPSINHFSFQERFKWVLHNDNQFHFQWCFPYESLEPSGAVQLGCIVALLDDGFTGILQKELREEEGLVYEINVSPENYGKCHALCIEAIVDKEQLLLFAQKLADLIQRLRFGKIDVDDLERMKKRKKIALDFTFDSSQFYMDELQYQWLYPNRPNFKEISTILDNQCQLSDINHLVPLIFDPGKSLCVIIGPCTDKRQDVETVLLQERRSCDLDEKQVVS